MGDRRRTSERVAVPFLADPEAWALLMVTSLNVGPGAPGPEDDWKIPIGPIDETATEDEVIIEPVHGEPPPRPTDRV